MKNRSPRLAEIRKALSRSRITALVGPRQCGKTTLARTLVPAHDANHFDLENPDDLRRLSDPLRSLGGLKGLVVIDEIHRAHDLFPVLRVLADRRPSPARFLILGSASPSLIRHGSESLAGRLETIELTGFTLSEAGAAYENRRWLRGGFPRSYLAKSDADSFTWRQQFQATFLERDVAWMASQAAPAALGRFWTMVAHMSAQVWNGVDPSCSLGISQPTVRRYLDLMTGLYMVRQLQPWHENLAKRQVKRPKVYIRDTGLQHTLLGIRTMRDLLSHPKAGTSWEGFVVEEALAALRPDSSYFWGTHSGAELDLLMFKGSHRWGIEVKRSPEPGITPSMRQAVKDLRLDRLVVIAPVAKPYELSDIIRVSSLTQLADRGDDLFK